MHNIYCSAADEEVWIGLTKIQHDCGNEDLASDLDCRRTGWTWADETAYRYPIWHLWFSSSPSEPNFISELCARLKPDGAWHGQKCDVLYSYICEKGNIHNNFLIMYMQCS